MKRILFIFTMLASLSAYSQEVISETSEYVAYQDTLFVLQGTTITNTGLEGVNDTLVQYLPPAVDSLGLVDLIHTRTTNTINTLVSKMRQSFSFRKSLSEHNRQSMLLGLLGVDLDVLNTALYGNKAKGQYRVITDTSDFVVEFIDHPSNPKFLRATGLNNEGNFNVRIYGRWWFAIKVSGVWQHVIWDGLNRDRQSWRSPTYAIPNSIQESNTFRLIKK